MKNFNCYCLCISLLILFSTSCDKENIDTNGIMNAVINGEKTTLKPDKATVYSGKNGHITILGRNCPKDKVMVILEVPIAVGSYSLGGESNMSFYRNSPVACENPGKLNPRKVIEANVLVTEVSSTRIKGTFKMVASSFDPQVTALITVEDGVFDVRRADL